jgi:hypothetical protein
MPNHPFRRLVGVACAAGAITASMATAPPASADPQWDLWNMVNDKHVAAGCAPYSHAPALSDIAVKYAQMMANNERGNLAVVEHGMAGVPVLDRELHNRGYNFSYLGEMDYSNINGGGSPQAAADFWQANLRDLINNCDMAQMDTAVWIINDHWAASSIMATPA